MNEHSTEQEIEFDSSQGYDESYHTKPGALYEDESLQAASRQGIRKLATWIVMIGLWPYIIATCLLFFDSSSQFIHNQNFYCLLFIVSWSVIMNCFTSGIHWTTTVDHNYQKESMFIMASTGLSVAIALFAIFAVLVSIELLEISLPLLMLGVLVQLVVDFHFARTKILSQWYWLIRRIVGFFMFASLTLSFYYITDGSVFSELFEGLMGEF